MYRIDNATAAVSMPTPGAVGARPNGFFTKGDPALAIDATIVDDDWLNAIQEEVCNVIEQSGITLDKTVRTQLYEAITSLVVGIPYAASTDLPNTYTATLIPAPLSYTTGSLYVIKFTHANTGAATLNLNGLGAKSMKRLDGSPLSAGDIYDGMMALITYDGTNIQVLNVNQQRVPFALSTSAANTYTATLSPPISDYVQGMAFNIAFTNANTDAATLNLNSLGAKNIVRPDGSALIAGDIVNGMVGSFIYDGTNLQLINPFAFTNAIAQKNLIRGGNMALNPWQRGTSFASCADGTFTADRFQWTQVGAGVVTVSRSTSLTAGLISGNVLSTASMKIEVTTADAAIAATDWYAMRYPMEGYDFAQIAQKNFVISFLVYATVTGTYTVGLSNSNGDRAYAATFTVNNSNTWQRVTIAIPASPSAGTWVYDHSGVGLDLRFVLAAGSNFTNTPNTWITTAGTNKVAATGQVNNMDTIGNIFAIDQVKIEEGVIATPYPKEERNQVLLDCQRYFIALKAAMGVMVTASFHQFQATILHPVPLRTVPTVTATTALTIIDDITGSFTQSAPDFHVINNDQYGGRYYWGNLSGLTAGHVASVSGIGSSIGLISAEL